MADVPEPAFCIEGVSVAAEVDISLDLAFLVTLALPLVDISGSSRFSTWAAFCSIESFPFLLSTL